MRRPINEAINAFVVIAVCPQAEALTILQRPPIRIRRRMSIANTSGIQGTPQQLAQAAQVAQVQPDQGPAPAPPNPVPNRRMSVADFRPNRPNDSSPAALAQAQLDNDDEEAIEAMETSGGNNSNGQLSQEEPMETSGGGDRNQSVESVEMLDAPEPMDTESSIGSNA